MKKLQTNATLTATPPAVFVHQISTDSVLDLPSNIMLLFLFFLSLCRSVLSTFPQHLSETTGSKAREETKTLLHTSHNCIMGSSVLASKFCWMPPSTKHMTKERESEYSLMIAALLVSFRRRNCLTFLTRSSSTSHTTSDSVWQRQQKHRNVSVRSLKIHIYG